jgi:Arc/MetJ family transcription regulator
LRRSTLGQIKTIAAHGAQVGKPIADSLQSAWVGCKRTGRNAGATARLKTNWENVESDVLLLPLLVHIERDIIHIEVYMRTNIEIDDTLMKQAMRSAKTQTKKETVEQGLRLLVRLKRQESMKRFFGKVKWEGNLEQSRRS